MSGPSFYDILGVSKTATDQEIKKAYRSLSLQYHPDRNSSPDARDKYLHINEAYETLSDSSKRELYDNPNTHFGDYRGDDMEGDNIQNIINMMFQGMAGGGPGIRVFHSNGGGPGPGFFFGHPHQQLQKPPSIVQQIEITLEQAYTGCTLPISINKWELENGKQKICPPEIITLNIIPGIQNNEVIVLRDQGHIVGDIHGDCKIIVNITPHSILERRGMDLVYSANISLRDALCGFSIVFKHIDGKILDLNNKHNKTVIQPGFQKVCPGMGMRRENMVGSLIVIFQILFPAKMTEEKRVLLENILGD